jgi:hypothetical protein
MWRYKTWVEEVLIEAQALCHLRNCKYQELDDIVNVESFKVLHSFSNRFLNICKVHVEWFSSSFRSKAAALNQLCESYSGIAANSGAKTDIDAVVTALTILRSDKSSQLCRAFLTSNYKICVRMVQHAEAMLARSADDMMGDKDLLAAVTLLEDTTRHLSENQDITCATLACATTLLLTPGKVAFALASSFGYWSHARLVEEAPGVIELVDKSWDCLEASVAVMLYNVNAVFRTRCFEIDNMFEKHKDRVSSAAIVTVNLFLVCLCQFIISHNNHN